MWCFMFHRYAKSALICAVPPFALFASGCSVLAAGNYSQSKDCANDDRNHTDSPLTPFNRGQDGRASPAPLFKPTTPASLAAMPQFINVLI
jgi:hypothetical protein